jgi:hypothetical protein
MALSEKTGGRIAGTPNKTTALARQLATPFADEAIQTILDVMRDKESAAASRIAAANSLLDRAFGKPRQELEHSGDAAQPLEIFIRHFNDPVTSDNSSFVPDLLN